MPPPVRLGHAPEEDLPSAAGQPITRRRFMKRTGGATVATLVAWNMASKAEAASMIGSVSEGHSDWGQRILICRWDPRDSDETEIRKTITCVDSYIYDPADREAWRKIPQIEFSDGMVPKSASSTIIDGWGQGVTYRLLHWLEYPAGQVVLRGHHVNADRDDSKLESTIWSWAAVVEGRWLYKRWGVPSLFNPAPSGAIGIHDGHMTPQSPSGYNHYVKDKYCYRILLIATRKLKGIVEPDSPDPKVHIEPEGEKEIPWLPFEFDITWNNPSLKLVGTPPVIVGWLQLGNYFCRGEGVDSETQKFVSVASIIPKSTLKESVATVQDSASVAWKISGQGVEVGGTLASSSSLAQVYGTNVAPKLIAHELKWRHLTRTTAPGITVSPSEVLETQCPTDFLAQCFGGLPADFIDQVRDKGLLKLDA